MIFGKLNPGDGNVTARDLGWAGGEFRGLFRACRASGSCLFDPSGRREIQRSICRIAPTRFFTAICRSAARPALRLSRAWSLPAGARPSLQSHISCCSIPTRNALAGALRWSDVLFGYRVGSPREDLSFDRRDSAAAMPKAVVADDSIPTGATIAARHALAETVIYEAHVRGLTIQREDFRSTSAALSQPWPISDYRASASARRHRRSSCCRSTPSCRTASCCRRACAITGAITRSPFSRRSRAILPPMAVSTKCGSPSAGCTPPASR